MVLSLAVGANPLPLVVVWHELWHHSDWWHHSDSEHGAIVRGLRLHRTLLKIAVGSAVGMAGALMQALTRKPLAGRARGERWAAAATFRVAPMPDRTISLAAQGRSTVGRSPS
jgi:ABC-type Fe3+-siderophore transport system permease subunit